MPAAAVDVTTCLIAFALSSCASTSADHRSAAAHEQMSKEEAAQADAHRSEAETHDRHAQQHAAMAQRLSAAVDEKCRGLFEENQWACPLTYEVTAVRFVTEGVDVEFTAGADMQRKLREMECQHAYGEAQGYADMDTCPLYLPDIQMSVSEEGDSILIRGRSERTVKEIQHRTRDHLHVHDTGPGRSLGPTGPSFPGGL